MRVALISDLHIHGSRDPTQAAFVRWLDALEVDQLVLLGDIFHAWWGYRQTVPVDYLATCAALQRVRERGIELIVVPGNHDFALGPFFTETLQAQVQSAHVRVIDGRRVCLAHGDEADVSAGYRLLTGVLRGAPFAAAMRLLGPVYGMRLLQRLARSSREHMVPAAPLLQAQEAWAAERIREGSELVVLGHLHHPQIVSLSGGQMVRLGGWGHDRTWCLLEDGHPTLVVTPTA